MLIHPLPDPIAIAIGPLAIRWYGLMYLAAFAQFIWLGRIRLRQPFYQARNWQSQHLDDLLFYGALGVIVGGRLGEVLLYHPAYYLQHPLEIFAIWQGGMSFHGGFMGVLLAMLWWARKHQLEFFQVTDLIAPLIPLGYAFGRIGNFINAELPGRLADPSLPWAMIWPNVDSLPRHPSPIYQALIDGLIPFLILWFYSQRPHSHITGRISAWYLILYGCARTFTEAFRTPDFELALTPLFSVSAGQLYSLPMIAIGAGLLYSRRNRDVSDLRGPVINPPPPKNKATRKLSKK